LQQHRDWPGVIAAGPWHALCTVAGHQSNLGSVTLIVVEEPGKEQFYVMCLDTAISGPRLIRHGSAAGGSSIVFGP